MKVFFLFTSTLLLRCELHIDNYITLGATCYPLYAAANGHYDRNLKIGGEFVWYSIM